MRERQDPPVLPDTCRGQGSSFCWIDWPVLVTPGRGARVTVAVGGAGWGGVAEGRGLAEELQEAALAVGLVVLLLEGALVELLEAEGTDEVLGVELLGHGGDAAAGDGLLAPGAQGAAPLVVVDLAVRLPVVLKEAAVDERREAFLPGGRGKRLGRCPGRCSRACHLCDDHCLLIISCQLG